MINLVWIYLIFIVYIGIYYNFDFIYNEKIIKVFNFENLFVSKKYLVYIIIW